MKAQFLIGLAAGAALMALTGCGGGAPDDQGGTAATTAQRTAATPAATPASDEAAARAFVDKLFAAYANDAEPDLFTKPAENFEPELATAIAKLGERSEQAGTIEASQEADPICACQDYGEVSYSIDTLSVEGTRATAVVTFTNFGKAEKRRIDLVATPGGWRIHDIDGTYRAAVFKDL